jgi:branched-chain amino acid transport system ATP-binding protein
MTTRNALEFKGLKKNFERAEIIRGVDLNIHEHERHVIIGPNGVGKSTLFNPVSGRIKLFGADIHHHLPRLTGWA